MTILFDDSEPTQAIRSLACFLGNSQSVCGVVSNFTGWHDLSSAFLLIPSPMISKINDSGLSIIDQGPLSKDESKS